MHAEALRVQGRGGDDDAQIRTPGKQPGEVAEEEVDVEGALVSLVDDDRVIGLEQSIAANRREQHAVRHDRDRGIRTRAVGEADAIPHPIAQGRLEFLRQPLGHCACGDASRLGVGDAGCPIGARAAEGLEDHLGDLGCLAGAGLAGDHDHLVVPERRDNRVASLRDRQVRGVMNAQARGVHRHEGTLEGPRVGIATAAGGGRPSVLPHDPGHQRADLRGSAS